MNLIKEINSYLNGELTEEQAMQLWIEMLKQPEYIDLLEMELMLREWFERRRSESIN